MQDIRDGKSERFYRRFESMAIICKHKIATVHGPNWRSNHGCAGVLKRFSGIEFWLLADNAVALHFLDMSSSIGDYPMAGNQLCANGAAVSYRHVVSEHEPFVIWLRLVGHESGIDIHVNVVVFRFH